MDKLNMKAKSVRKMKIRRGWNT